MASAIAHALNRRKALRSRFDVARQMTEIEETCIPSYLHGNVFAAGAAWARLFAAKKLYSRFAPAGPVLDFGAASGELFHVLPRDTSYDFAEIDEGMAQALVRDNPKAVRHDLNGLPGHRYAAIFALDSLEHNEDVGAIVDRLVPALRTDGVFILSGPTENALYRLGRKIAGFSGAYHKTTIHHIEAAVSQRLRLLSRRSVPVGLPLFSVSCWKSA